MLEMPATGLASWPANRPPAFVASEIERHLKSVGATLVVRRGNQLEFGRLPLRQFFHAFYVQNGSYEVSSPGTHIQVSFRASVPVLPALVPFLLVALLMGAMAVQSGAPVANIAGILLVAAVAFVAAVRAAAGFGLRSIALSVRAISSGRSA